MCANRFVQRFWHLPCQRWHHQCWVYTQHTPHSKPDHCNELLMKLEVWSELWQLPRSKMTPILQSRPHAFTLKYLICCRNLSVGISNLFGAESAKLKPKPTWMPQISPNSKHAGMSGDKTASRLLALNFGSDLRRVTCLSRFWRWELGGISARWHETSPSTRFNGV